MADRTSTVRVNVVTDASGAGAMLGKFGRVAGAAALGVGALGVATGVAGYKAVQAASDVEQSFGALDTVFKDNAKIVKRWADQAADSVGLAKGEYANLSAIVGAQLQNMGLGLDESTGQSKRLIELAADLAATFGGPVSDAVGAVSALLRGEVDPIERYGVSIKAADVNARLASLGLDDLTGKAAKQARAQATLELLTRQTADAQGAFGRESDTLAGQQARLTAEWENAKAALGEKLIPFATAAIKVFREDWAPVLADVAGKVERTANQLGERLAPTVEKVERFIREKGIPAAREFGGWLQDHLFPAIRDYVIPALDGARDGFHKVEAAVRRNKPELEDLWSKFKKVAEFVTDDVMPIMGRFAGTNLRILGTALGTAIDVLGNFYAAWQNLFNIIGQVISKIQAAIDKLHELQNAQNRGTGVKGGGGSASTTSSGVGSTPPPGGTHRVNVNINGPVTDPRGTARELERVLRRNRIAVGGAA